MRKLLLSFFFLILWSVSSFAAARFAVCTVTCTWDASSTAMWSTSTGGATGASVPVAADTVTLDGATCVGGVTCTITVNTNITITSLTMGACTASTAGCILDFSANNNNITLTGTVGFSNSGTGTRTLNMGNGIWTVGNNGAGNQWDISTATNFTLNANSSTLNFTFSLQTATHTLTLAARTYNIVNISAGGSQFPIALNGSPTIATLGLTPPLKLTMSQGGTVTITNAFNFVGTAFSNAISLSSGSAGTAATLSVASGSPGGSWVVLTDITCSGGATFAFTNSIDLQHNTTCGITGPGGVASGHIIGGTLLNRDLKHNNDNTPAFIDIAA